MKNWRLILTALMFLALGSTSLLRADAPFPRIDAYLQEVLLTTPEQDYVEAYLFIKDRLSLADLQPYYSGQPRQARRATVVNLLRGHAEATQTQVLSYLRSREADGAVERISVIWLINAIAFQAKAEVIYDLAEDFAEIEKIYYDARPPLEEVLDDNGIAKANLENGNIFEGTNVINPGLTLINAPLVWAEGDSGQGALVANIDTGADWDHPDIIHQVWNNLGEDADGDGRTLEPVGNTMVLDPGDMNGIDDDGNGYVDDLIGWDFDFNDNDPNDGGSHGTATTGIVVGDGTNGNQTGVAPRAKIMILKNNNASESQIWMSMQYAIMMGADVTTSSLSWKWAFSPKPNYAGWRQATDMELAAGLVHTNSTGNQGNQSAPGCNNSYPVPYNISAPGNSPSAWIHPDQTPLIGGISSVIGCGDVNALTDFIESSSGMGPAAWEATHLRCPNYPYTIPPQYQDYPWSWFPPSEPDSMGLLKPDVSAPGASTISTTPGGGYGGFGGTSGATPHVAGVVALMLSVNPDLTPEDVSRIIQTTSVEKGAPGKDIRYGAGRIDAYQAYLQSLAEAGAPNAPANFSAYSDYQTPTSMMLSWQDPTQLLNGDTLIASDFQVMIERDGVLIDSVGGGAMSYTDQNLTDGQEYHYRIFAKTLADGKISGSIETSWICGGSPIPSGVISFSVAGNQTQVTLSWESPVANIDGTPMDDYAGVNLYQNGVLAAAFTRTSADTGQADSDVYTPAVAGFYDWYIAVIDNEVPANESTPSDTLGTPLSLPLADEFNTPGEPNPGIWINSHTDVNDRAVNPPSGGLSLNLNGTPNGEDMLDLKPLDLSGMQGSGVRLSYYYQPQGTGNSPETDDSLRIYFKNDLGQWVLVRAYEGTPLQPFVQEIIDVESAPNGGGSYFHGQFQIRLRSTGGSGVLPNDDWFVDDLVLQTPTGIVEDNPLPKQFAVRENYPNPFNPSTTIRYQLPEQTRVKLVVYNTLGQTVRVLVNSDRPAGYHQAVWDGRNDQGVQVASGIYLFRFEAGSYQQVRKMVLLK